MKCTRAVVAAIFAVATSFVCQTALAQRGNAIDTLAAQMNEAGQTGRSAEGLALAQKLEGLVRRQQGTDNMNCAGVLHNEGMFLQNLGRYQEAVDKLNAALTITSTAAVKLTTGAFAALRENPGIGRAEAMRRSIRALIADRSSASNADPSTWAPFVLVGEGG